MVPTPTVPALDTLAGVVDAKPTSPVVDHTNFVVPTCRTRTAPPAENRSAPSALALAAVLTIFTPR